LYGTSADTTGLEGGQAGEGTSPLEGGAEGFPESGYGPQNQEHASGQADAIANFMFIVSIGMLGAGFALQRRSRRNNG